MNRYRLDKYDKVPFNRLLTEFQHRTGLCGLQSWRLPKTLNWDGGMGFLRHEGMYEYI